LSYQIEYADAAIEHLKFLTTRQQRTVLDTVDEQLKYEVVVHSNGTLEVRTLKNFSQVDELS
jgi:hypothetical protein